MGFDGYPNVGKSSVINSLKKQKCCKSAHIPEETKIWQYIAFTKRIYLFDCPGVVYEGGQSDIDRVLKNVVRSEKIEEPMIFVQGFLDRVHSEMMKKIYKINSLTDSFIIIMKLKVTIWKIFYILIFWFYLNYYIFSIIINFRDE